MGSALDIDDLIKYAKKQGADFGVKYLMMKFPWAATPWISWLTEPLFRMVVQALLDEADLFGFKVNSAFLTSAQAAEYRAAVAKLHGVSKNISDEEWEKLENEASESFRNLVRYSA